MLPAAGPGSPTFEFAGTGRSFLKSRAGSGRPNVTGGSPLIQTNCVEISSSFLARTKGDYPCIFTENFSLIQLVLLEI
jgi:hypothetical protein